MVKLTEKNQLITPLITLLVFLLVVPILTLWPSLNGPFLFDDIPNLDALGLLQGELTSEHIADYLSSKSAGPTGRPLSMLSFLLNDVSWPSDPYSFKYTNILVHVLNGLLLAWLIIKIADLCWPKPQKYQQTLALLIAAFWVLNPYQLSSVAYVVQRMALLSTLCVLGGLLFYVTGRRYLSRDQNKLGFGLIWVSYILGAGIGSLCKENAALYVLLIPLFEWTLFSRQQPQKIKKATLWATILIPAIIMVYILGKAFFEPHAYNWFRDFTLEERLLSQGRALGYYLWRYLIPGISYTGVYTDGFDKSIGLFSPPSTFIWLAAHALIIGLAITFSKRLPLLSLGVLFFYVAHSMEAGAIPLELFFEHRNYLPSAILLLGILHFPHSKKTTLIISLLVATCASLQYIQANYWGNERHLYAIMVTENPTSERAIITYASLQERQGKFTEALALLRNYTNNHSYGSDIALNIVKIGCFLGEDSAQDASILVNSVSKYRGKASSITSQVRDIAQWIHEGRCRTIKFDDLSSFLDGYMTAFPRDPEATQAQYIARAYIAYYRKDQTTFHDYLIQALNTHTNPRLAYSACTQIAVSEGNLSGCKCFQQYQQLLDHQERPTVTQRLLGAPNKLKTAYQRELALTCKAVIARQATVKSHQPSQ